MAFTGKPLYSKSPCVPDGCEDVSDIIGLVSPFETPLLDHLGDPQRDAMSTVHEWLEYSLLPNSDAINDSTYTNALTDTTFVVDNGSRFRVGDLIQVDGSLEVMLVTAIATNTLTVTRGYGATTAEALADNQVIHILGNAALEGDDRPATRFTNRLRRINYTQIFTAGVEVSGSQLAARHIALADELDYQKQERLRNLIRYLENCAINGVGHPDQGHGGRMLGILGTLSTNEFKGGFDGFPRGDGGLENLLSEKQIDTALRLIWEQSSGYVDTIVVSGYQKRRINSFMASSRQYGSGDENFRDLRSIYESDFGVCRVVLSRWVPADTVLLLDSSRVNVMPLDGRSFHYVENESDEDRVTGTITGEYTIELRNENSHGVIRGLSCQ